MRCWASKTVSGRQLGRCVYHCMVSSPQLIGRRTGGLMLKPLELLMLTCASVHVIYSGHDIGPCRCLFWALNRASLCLSARSETHFHLARDRKKSLWQPLAHPLLLVCTLQVQAAKCPCPGTSGRGCESLTTTISYRAFYFC